jgi:dihydroflavonol-4-reductase
MKILVTGGTGFLGTHLVPRLVSAGHQVRMLARSRPAQPREGVEFVQGDLKDRAAVRAAVQGVEAIYHLAGLVSFKPEDGRKMYELHVDCTRELLRDVRDAGAKPRVILVSTSGAVSVHHDARVGDERAEAPIDTVGRWPYYLSKIYEEKLTIDFCRKHDLPLVVLNPALLMGPGDDRLSSTWTVVKFLQGDIVAMPGGGMCFVDARDVADAAVSALTRGDLCGRHLMGVNLTMAEFFQRLERLSGVGAPRVRLPKQLTNWGGLALGKLAAWRGVPAPLDPHEVEIGEHWFWVDSSKAERELGFRARDVYETLHDTVAYTMTKLPANALPGTRGRLHALRTR